MKKKETNKNLTDQFIRWKYIVKYWPVVLVSLNLLEQAFSSVTSLHLPHNRQSYFFQLMNRCGTSLVSKTGQKMKDNNNSIPMG